jgi:hypothetical protein
MPPEPAEHRGEISRNFVNDICRASCSCGWRDDSAYTSPKYAEEALRRHLEAAALSPGDQDAS